MSFGLDDIVGLIEDAASIPGDLLKEAKDFLNSPGGAAGIFVSGATIFVGGPMAVVPAVIAGIAATEAVNELLIKTREMNPEERTLAELVFGKTLPPFEKIKLTNLAGLGDRPFTTPTATGYLVNLGQFFENPIRCRLSHYPEHGELLIHELTHVWQIFHSKFVPGLMCEGILNQAEFIFGKDVYKPEKGKNWDDYNMEQQATLVDLWYGGYVWQDSKIHRPEGMVGCSKEHPFYRYVMEVNGGAPPPAVQTLSVRDLARRKFGAQGSFAIKGCFPRYKTGSLRRSMIGLTGSDL